MPTAALADAASARADSSWSPAVSLRTRLTSASRMAYARQKTGPPGFQSADAYSDFELSEDSDKPSAPDARGRCGRLSQGLQRHLFRSGSGQWQSGRNRRGA